MMTLVLELVLRLHACQIVVQEVFFFSFMAHQDYFTPLSRVNWWVRQKQEIPRKNTCNPTHKQNLAKSHRSDLS